MTIKIDQRIVKCEAKQSGDGEQVSESKPSPPVWKYTKRPRKLIGATWKIVAPGAYKESIYVTINSIETPYGVRPLEIFIMSRSQDSFQWITFSTRIISALFRQQVDQPVYETFVVDEMLEIFDPAKSYFSPEYQRLMHSVVQEMGFILREHLEDLGLLERRVHVKKEQTLPTLTRDPVEVAPLIDAHERMEQGIEYGASEQAEMFDQEELWEVTAPNLGAECAECHEMTVVMLDGCMTCAACGDSKCG